MNDKDRELIQQILNAAGSTAVKGFEYMVQWQIFDGISSLIACLIVIVLAAWAFKKLVTWQFPKPENRFDDNLGYHMVRGACVGVACITVVLCIFGVSDSLTRIFAPQGAAIHSLLSKK